MPLKEYISYNLQSSFGQPINHKFIIIESDDWGSIRMPSRKIFNKLVVAGLPIENDVFNKYDNLASKDDLCCLLDVLSKFKDHAGNNPVFTVNVVTGNPDFKRIRDSKYTHYFIEPFYDTIEKQQPGALNLWEEALNKKFFLPQFHGRDHVNIDRWLNALRSNDSYTHLAFNSEVYGIAPSSDSSEYYMAALDYPSDTKNNYLQECLNQGLDIFREYFKFLPLSFIPPCYICSLDVINYLDKKGVKGLQGKVFHFLPIKTKNGKRKYKKMFRVSGYHKTSNRVNLVRNVFFEPCSDQHFDFVSNALKRIETAFSWKKPAIISTHRVNYIGSIEPKNRQNSLNKLDLLLRGIIKQWPDVEFISSHDLVHYYMSLI
jgi:hypothetical protein